MIELLAGQCRLVLDPATGGAVAAFDYGGVEVLRPVADARLAAQRGRAVAAYPLIPYANRIAWGRFSFGGESFVLDRNFGDHPHTIHGNAWMHPWVVAVSDASSAVLAFDYVPGDGGGPAEWPYAYCAEQHFALDGAGLTIRLSVENRDARPWPAGLGLHPYVVRTPHTQLRFEADTIWTNDGDSLPAERQPVQGEAEFDRGRDVSDAVIDNCFAGWGGVAEVTWPEQDFTLCLSAIVPLDHLQLYTPAGRDFLGLEPVSNMPDAINRMDLASDQGLRILAPGERLEATIRFSIREK